MKKLSLIAMAFVFLMGITGCKKEAVEPATATKVGITFAPENSGAKLGIGLDGVLSWSDGDKIWVYSDEGDGKLLGSISYNKSADKFSGSIEAWTDGSTLTFYFLGDNVPADDGSIKINFSDQSYSGTQNPENDLENIAKHFWVSRRWFNNVPSTQTSFSGMMLNEVSVAIFNTSGFGSGNVKIYANNRLFNQYSINAEGTLTVGVAGTSRTSGHIITGPAAAKRYVALLHSGHNEVMMQFTSQSKVGYYEAGVINTNQFLYSGDHEAITVSGFSDVPVSNYVDLAVASNHVFSVADGKTVKFAKGNLVYNQVRFKMHKEQYGNINSETYSSHVVEETFDHFQWGTSGWDNGSAYYMPYLEKENTYNLINTDLIGNNDWGAYQFGMNTGASWRTPTKDEWVYLISGRSNASDKYGLGSANGVQGLILLPDTWERPSGMSFTPGVSNVNSYTAEQWASMEANGAVFLPASSRMVGWQDGIEHPNMDGYYWSSSNSGNGASYFLVFSFYNSGVNPQDSHTDMRHCCSVRLVQDVE